MPAVAGQYDIEQLAQNAGGGEGGDAQRAAGKGWNGALINIFAHGVPIAPELADGPHDAEDGDELAEERQDDI